MSSGGRSMRKTCLLIARLLPRYGDRWSVSSEYATTDPVPVSRRRRSIGGEPLTQLGERGTSRVDMDAPGRTDPRRMAWRGAPSHAKLSTLDCAPLPSACAAPHVVTLARPASERRPDRPAARRSG